MTPVRAFIAALVLTATSAGTQEPTPAESPFAWLGSFLETHSTITIAATDDSPREIVSTRWGRQSYRGIVLEYTRSTYDAGAPDTVKRHQRILYIAGIADIDPDTIAVQNAGEPAPGVTFWMVSFNVRPDPGFFEYHNFLEHYGETKTPQVFTSKGKIRTIILGYLADEKQANQLAEKFRASLKAALEAQPTSTRPDQSAA